MMARVMTMMKKNAMLVSQVWVRVMKCATKGAVFTIISAMSNG